MDTIFAYKLFENKDALKSMELGEKKHITIDFSKVNDFNLQNIRTLLNLQKIAVFNDIKLDIKNTTPLIEKELFQTGLYRNLDGFSTNSILASKRFNFS